MTTLDDAAERAIRTLVENYRWRSRSEGVEDFIRAAWTEATEAAAKKCEERARLHAEQYGEAAMRRQSEAEGCAAAIRR